MRNLAGRGLLLTGRIRVGVGGWTFEPWRGTFYPDDLAQKRELEYASRQLTLDRDQRHLLRLAEARELPQVARRDARRLRLRAQGPALRHQPPHPRRGRRVDRPLLRDRRHRARRQARPGQLAVRRDQEVRPRRLRRLPRAAARRRRRPRPPPRPRGPPPSFADPDFVALAREHGVAIVLAGDSDFPLIADPTAPFVYARIMGTDAAAPGRLRPRRPRRLGRPRPRLGRQAARPPTSRRSRTCRRRPSATSSSTSSAAPRSATPPPRWR